MKLSKRGLELIQSFEGYHTALPDGGCRAYLDELPEKPIWTIGFGCTEGVYEGLTWTRAQADAAFMRELAKHEVEVLKRVTVELNQHEFDALVSFSYNCGPRNLQLLIANRLNRGDRAGTARALPLYNKAGGNVHKGLVRRRAAEAALFLEPVEASADPVMPQRVDEPAAKPTGSRKWSLIEWLKGLFAVPAVGTAGFVSADQMGAAKTWLDTVKSFASDYGVTLVIVLCVGGFIIAQIVQKLAETDYQEGRYIPSGEAE